MRVIAIDDEFLVLSGLTRTIKKIVPSGTDVMGFRVPAEAIKYAREHTVDVAFVNVESSGEYKAPRMHGLILAMELKRLNPKINLIFVSATYEYGDEAWKLHVSDYLRKPVRPQRIERALVNLRYSEA